MENEFLDILSVEKYAAFLDGNLTPDEMQEVASLIDHDEALRQIHDASLLADETFESYLPEDLRLPPEIECESFVLPTLEEPLHCLEDSLCEVAACDSSRDEGMGPFSKDESIPSLSDDSTDDFGSNGFADDSNVIESEEHDNEYSEYSDPEDN